MTKSHTPAPAFVLLAALFVPSSLLLGGPPATASASPAAGAAAPAAALIAGAAAPVSLTADVRAVDGDRESVVVTGKGEVSAEPDTLIANFAVETTASTVGAALDSAKTAATRMRDALVAAGLPKADLQTSNVGINSQRDEDGKITGYTVDQGLTARTRDLPRAGTIVSAALAAGGEAARLNGVSFTIEDDTALLVEARKKAFADARRKAELYAREAARPLGRVVKVSEETPRPWGAGEQDRTYAAGLAADAPVPIEPGRQTLAVTITVEWALDPAS